MPKQPNIKKQIENCKHPNSRKTIALTKQIKKIENRKKSKNSQFMKQNLVAEKVLWFRDNILPDTTICTVVDAEKLILKYLARFDEELEQIAIKHSVGSRKNRQHASREDIINMTKKRETEEFNTCGIEIPDILTEKNLHTLLKWNGELRFLQNLKLQRVSKKYLQQYANKSIKLQSVQGSNKNENVLCMDTN